MKHTADDTRKGMHIQAAQKWKKDNPEALAKYQRRRQDRKRTPKEIKKLIDRYARRIEELKEVLAEKER